MTAAMAGTAETNRSIRGSVPAGDYRGLVFRVGVPVLGKETVKGKIVSLNHSSHTSAPPPLDSAPMGWSWQVGRKFMKIELLPESPITRANGPRAPSGPSISAPPAASAIRCRARSWPAPVPIVSRCVLIASIRRKQIVVLDLAELFGSADLNVGPRGGGGCMSSLGLPACQALFDRLGLNLDESAPAAGDAGEPRQQGPASLVFRIEG